MSAEASAYFKVLYEIYEEHNPDKWQDVLPLLAKYAGDEHTLYRKVCKKYNLTAKPSDGICRTAQTQPATAPVAENARSSVSPYVLPQTVWDQRQCAPRPSAAQSYSNDLNCVVCTVHGKYRTTINMVDDGTGGFRCCQHSLCQTGIAQRRR